MELNKLVSYLDTCLEPEFPLRDVSVNGLQFPGKAEIKRVAVAVDASLETFEAAVEEDCDFLFVHHGLFWNFNRENRITPLMKKKLKVLMDSDLSLYASHLPLDAHAELGNNAELARVLKLKETSPFAEIGIRGKYDEAMEFDAFCERIFAEVNEESQCYHFSGGPVKRVAIVSGGGQQALAEMAASGRFDTFVTGEMAHYMYHVAKEHEINVVLAGHYKTETFGPLAVGRKLEQELALEVTFLDYPTGL
jgi:dinuclear metal center YbgI/SA1388 family protein